VKERKKIVTIRVALAIGLTLIIIGLGIWFVIGFSVGRFTSSNSSKSPTAETSQVNTATIKEQPVTYFNQFLPFESEANYDPNTQGFNLFYDLMRYFSSVKVQEDVRIDSYSVSGAAYQDGVLTVKFTVWPKSINQDTMTSYWGKVSDDGSVRGICWQVTVGTTAQGDTAITEVASGDSSIITDENNQMTTDSTTNQTIAYKTEIGKSQLKVTYDGWEHQVIVPYPLDDFFGGEYSGDQQELIDASYVLTPAHTGFIRTEYASDNTQAQNVYYTYTEDQGITWQDVALVKETATIRFRKLAFTGDDFGYVFLSGGRVMGQEGYSSYVTADGGKTWQEKQVAKGVSQLLTDACYINTKVGFMSFGGVTPTEPSLYVTTDGGNTWLKSSFEMPEELQSVFIVAEAPYLEDGKLQVLVNQGSLGDYQGGTVKGLFTSEDNGVTWTYVSEVDDQSTEQG
jgi:hypothetical protein